MKDRVMIVGGIVAVHLIVISLFIFSGDDASDGDEFNQPIPEEVADSPVTDSDLNLDGLPVDGSPEDLLAGLHEELTSDVPQGEMYIVKPGDSLMAISKVKYGTSKHYLLIYENNKDTLNSPQAVRVGQKLFLPEIP